MMSADRSMAPRCDSLAVMSAAREDGRSEPVTKPAPRRISPDEHRARSARLLEHLGRENLEGAVLFDPSYVLYFAGFSFIPTERPIAYLLGSGGTEALWLPRLELEHARAESRVERIETYPEYPSHDHPMQGLGRLLVELGIRGPIGADSDGYPWVLGYRGPDLSEVSGASISRLNGVVEDLMMVKSQAESALIRESAVWAGVAHRLLQQYTRAGATETEVSLRASQEATLALVEAVPDYRSGSFFWNGASAGYRGQIGRNAALPHALDSHLRFQPGDVLVTGAGAPMWGYHSELERTLILGKPSARQRELFEHMTRIQELALEALRPGRLCSDVDRAARRYYEQHGLVEHWRHHTGHAIGLRYHEGPFLDVGDPTPIRSGMVFTVEPGLYVPDVGGFRHSDTVWVTEDGAELLTRYPRDLESLTLPA